MIAAQTAMLTCYKEQDSKRLTKVKGIDAYSSSEFGIQLTNLMESSENKHTVGNAGPLSPVGTLRIIQRSCSNSNQVVRAQLVGRLYRFGHYGLRVRAIAKHASGFQCTLYLTT